ncbi:leucine-rich repeat domain-containing protein [Microcoleus sp.]|uniref:leucine-rich repeat domain-containing protein n=1 Tax=Microcoleus sp. TaxID=44472 RepID=UPI00403E59D6
MTLIVAEKHMNLPKSIALTGCAILALSANGLSAKAAETRSGNSRRTFADWCRQKANLSPEAKRTVEVLLQKAETTECEAANLKLSSLTQLLLDNNQISDIKPLESLTNLTLLFLDNNQISDIKPLESLTKLTLLVLANNQIRDIKPLQSLTNLKLLHLGDNQISDIKPLESLTNLTLLVLGNNKISDIKPLESLTNLTEIRLSGNPIAPKTCPLKPESICKWEPRIRP